MTIGPSDAVSVLGERLQLSQLCEGRGLRGMASSPSDIIAEHLDLPAGTKLFQVHLHVFHLGDS
jgi:hypothetical protein